MKLGISNRTARAILGAMAGAAFTGAFLPASVAQADTLIDTTSFFNSSTQPFGIPDSQTYGQTISVPTDGNFALESYTFLMHEPSTLAFRGEVYAWDSVTGMAVGPDLYESPVMSTTGSSGFEAITFTPAGLPLVPGAEYVIFATSSKDNAGHSGQGQWEITGDSYTSGQFVYLNNGTDTTQWTTTPWSVIPNSRDLAFKADFGTQVNPALTTAPLPSSSVAGFALLLVAGVLNLRARKTATQ